MRPAGVPRGDAGSGSVLALAVVAVVLSLVVMVGGLASVQGARGSARAAADLAALAVASTLAVPPGLTLAPQAQQDPCALARAVVERNGARPAGCRVDGPVVTVRAERATLLGTAGAVARAGPASARGAGIGG